MALKWNCLESLTAIGIGVGACALAPLDMGLTAGAVIGGAGLFARIKENSRKAGLDDEKLIGRMQRQLLKELDHWDQHAERKAAERADEAMGRLLPLVMLTREQLAATATQSPDTAERYPVLAAFRIVEELAKHDAMFNAPQPGGTERYERVFALQAIEGALRVAKNDPDYATLLTLDITIELGRAIAETTAAVRQLELKIDEVRLDGHAAEERDREIIAAQDRQEALLAQLVAGQQASAAAQGINAEKLKALAQRIVAKVDDTDEAERALSAAIDELLKLREEIRRGTNFGDDVDEAIRRIFEKVENNDFDAAARQAEEEYLRATEREDEARRARAKLIHTNISIARIAYDAKALARWVLEQKRVEAGGELTCDIARAEQRRWYQDANEKGLLLELDVAIELANLSADLSTDDVERAKCENNLANALTTKGDWVGGQTATELLTGAISVFRKIATMQERDGLRDDWALTQNNLGIALASRSRRAAPAPSR